MKDVKAKNQGHKEPDQGYQGHNPSTFVQWLMLSRSQGTFQRKDNGKFTRAKKVKVTNETIPRMSRSQTYQCFHRRDGSVGQTNEYFDEIGWRQRL